MPPANSARLLGASGLSPGTFPPDYGLSGQRPTPPRLRLEVPLPARQPSRTRLDSLHPSLHCSIVGTCFGLRELRQLVVKFADPSLAQAGDHTIHTEAVRWASRRDGLGKVLGKALERKFKPTIARFAHAADVTRLRQLWLGALASGDIPDAYWAVLAHPAASEELVREAFSDVHMLSHLVGAANRADIRRLQDLEREKSALEAKLTRQQRHLNTTLGAKERHIRELLRLLEEHESGAATDQASAETADALRRERLQRMQLERRVDTLEARLAPPTEAPARIAPTTDSTAEPPFCCSEHVPPMAAGSADCRDTILLVGGRPAQVPPLSRAVADAGGTLLHHDGGIEMSLSLLPGLVGRADRVLLALDSVSHAAAGTARRLARSGGKVLEPLPTLSLTSLTRAVGRTEKAIDGRSS